MRVKSAELQAVIKQKNVGVFMSSYLKGFILLLFSSSLLLAQNLKITHYDLNLELLPSQHKLIAESAVTVKSDSSNPVNELIFILTYDKIDSITDLPGNKYAFKRIDEKLIIDLNKPVKHNDSLTLKFNYQGIFNGRVSNRIDEKNSWLLGESNFYPQLENQYLSNRATFNSKITVPDSITVVSPGKLISINTLKNKRTFTYKSTEPLILYGLSAASYFAQEKYTNGIKITSYLYNEHKSKSDTLISLFSKILSFYQKQFGKYPFDNFKIVETERRGGYAPKGMMLLSSKIISHIDDIGLFIIAHETAHQWFPHQIQFSPDHYLNESFAQYAAFSYFKIFLNNYNKTKTIKYLFLNFNITYDDFFRLAYRKVYEEKPLSEISFGDRDYRWGAYYKGFYFLNGLASTLGMDTFNNLIKKLIESNRIDRISLDNFIKYLEDESKQNLSNFVHDFIYTNKILDYDVSDVTVKKTDDGKYKTDVEIKNNWNMFTPVEVKAIIDSNKTLTKTLKTFSGNKATVEFLSDKKISKIEVDPNSYTLDANRINNYYPRKREFSFLFSTPSYSKSQYFYYPSITYSKRDDFRLGLWLSNIFPLEFLEKNLEHIKWRAGLFYGFDSRRIGYYLNFKTVLGIPSYKWNWGMNLSNYRGTENYSLSTNYIFQKDDNHGRHNIINISAKRNLIYDIAYYDDKDFENGTNNTLSFNWDRKLYNETENMNIKFGGKFLGSNYSYSRISMELENFLPISIYWLNYRIFGGIVRGNYPKQEALFLSGSVYPTSFPYWFVDPGNNISTQENLHVKGDANLRGYIGQHLKGQNGFGINLEIPIPKFKIIKLFFDVGNVWDNSFGSLKYDTGLGLDFKYLRIDFPIYINQPTKDEKPFDFRWLLEFNFKYSRNAL